MGKDRIFTAQDENHERQAVSGSSKGEQDHSWLWDRILRINREAARWFQDQLLQSSGNQGMSFLGKRHVERETAERFCLGFAPDGRDNLLKAMETLGFSAEEVVSAGLAYKDSTGVAYDRFRNRLIFPVQDAQGEVRGFSGRFLGGGTEAIYLNSPETIAFHKRDSLYGIYQAQYSQRNSILLVEGFFDVVVLHQMGFDNAVATVGTAFTLDQLRLVPCDTTEIILSFDNDHAGQTAAERALDILKGSKYAVKVLKLPDSVSDAVDFIVRYGSPAFEELLTGRN